MSNNSDHTQHPIDKCSSCQKDIVKIFKLFHKATCNGDTTKKRRKYVDETGRLWHGTRCPDCTAQWRKDRIQKARDEVDNKLKQELGE